MVLQRSTWPISATCAVWIGISELVKRIGYKYSERTWRSRELGRYTVRPTRGLDPRPSASDEAMSDCTYLSGSWRP